MAVVGRVLLASLIASFSDWLFMDVLVHRLYAADPAIWRSRGGTARIVLSQCIGTLATAGVVVLCSLSASRPMLLAAIAWSAGPLPIILQNAQWMRLHPAIGVSHAAGWLARAVIAAELAVHLGPR